MGLKILITGNMGYVGSVLVKYLRNELPDSELIGFDRGFFSHCLVSQSMLPETYLNSQIFGDVRQFPEELLHNIDAVVYLSAVSNDPMGNIYEKATYEINYHAGIKIAQIARSKGVNHFVFASSCSVYGFNEGIDCDESAPLNPLTAYAKSKVFAEDELSKLASDDFIISCLRFATACGTSDRLRLDLVLNDFVASALTSGTIKILSDGTPWRPLINVSDMSRAIHWACIRQSTNGGDFCIVNTGSNQWNYRVYELAEAIKELIPGTEIDINKNAQPDKRSYRVNFDKYNSLAPDFQPIVDLNTAISQLRCQLEDAGFNDNNFRQSNLYMRLNTLNQFCKNGIINIELY